MNLSSSPFAVSTIRFAIVGETLKAKARPRIRFIFPWSFTCEFRRLFYATLTTAKKYSIHKGKENRSGRKYINSYPTTVGEKRKRSSNLSRPQTAANGAGEDDFAAASRCHATCSDVEAEIFVVEQESARPQRVHRNVHLDTEIKTNHSKTKKYYKIFWTISKVSEELEN